MNVNNKLLDKYAEKMESMKVKSEVGAGFVKIEIDGFGYILKIKCDEKDLNNLDITMLLDLIRIAYNDAYDKLDDELKVVLKDEFEKFEDKKEI
jgi:DNA-binding protein YbaB